MGYLNVCAIAKNEALYIAEWIKFHKAMGADRVVVYNNESSDFTDAVASRERNCEVHYITGKAKQLPTYNYYMQQYRHDCIWTAFIDIDEFLVPLHSDSLVPMLRLIEPIETISGVGIQWRLFGSSGELEYKEMPVIKRFPYRQDNDNPHIKCIIRNSHFLKAVSPHWFETKQRIVNEKGVPLNGSLTPPDIFSADHFQCNHYAVKSRQESRERRKLIRADVGLLRNDEEYFEAHDRNEVRDMRAIELYNRYIG